ncbi:accessory gland protein Acp29AB [Drosophila biarmipes]|uniref:accessory gland protein Acp29AB n=1 Tax=Drosophila biarmipes TaxID=125945 RepID=UPI0007E835F8|nr:accessory gland protein Acp29AB [Drosophila biarmipes]
MFAPYFLFFLVLINLLGAQKNDCPRFPWYDTKKQRAEVCLVDLPPLFKLLSNDTKKDTISSALDKIESALGNTKKEINSMEPYVEKQMKELKKKIEREHKIKELEAALKLTSRTLHCTLENKKIKNLGMLNPKFEKIGSRYFYIEKYVRQDWFDAWQKCREIGGHLAFPQNEAELHLIYKKLEPRWYWIDLSDLVDVHKWRSLLTGQDAPFPLVWNPGEPKKNGSQERCVFAYANKLSTVHCDYRCLYICQAVD